MCTIFAIKGLHPTFPLVVAANRDEFYARPASPPAIVREAPRVLAGIDRAKGGTWMGANERGVFVAITNQRSHRGPDSRRITRGELVLEALAQRDVLGVDAFVESLDARDYNAFNLMWGDASALRVGYGRSEARDVEVVPLGDGLHVLTNDRIGSPDFPKAARVSSSVTPFTTLPWERLAPELARVLADHEKPAIEDVPEPPAGSRFDRAMLRELQAICIHTAVYGTCSATILALEPGRVAHYLFADGPPCRAPFREVGDALNR